MGDNYEISSWPGYVGLWKSREEGDYERIISSPDHVTAFALTGQWLIGQTQRDWFAIDKKTNKLYRSDKSLDDLVSGLGLNPSTIKLEHDPMPYEIIHKSTPRFMAKARRVIWFVLFAVPAALFAGPLLKYLFRKAKKCTAPH